MAAGCVWIARSLRNVSQLVFFPVDRNAGIVTPAFLDVCRELVGDLVSPLNFWSTPGPLEMCANVVLLLVTTAGLNAPYDLIIRIPTKVDSKGSI
jgi:hypothetical protein